MSSTAPPPGPSSSEATTPFELACSRRISSMVGARARRTASSISALRIDLPGQFLTGMVEEPAAVGKRDLRQHTDHVGDALVDREIGGRAAHVGAYPAGVQRDGRDA